MFSPVKIAVVLKLLILMLLIGIFSLSEASQKNDNILYGSRFNLKLGHYVGFENDYDTNLNRPVYKRIDAILKKDEIIINDIATKFTLRDDKFYVDTHILYEIIGPNRFMLLADGGVIFEYAEK